MEKQELMLNNKIIAEFMGWESNKYFNLPNKLHKISTDGEVGIQIKDLQYHSSWDWLMHVIHKIDLIFEKDIIEERGQDLWHEITVMLLKLNIERTHHAVIEFIQWYNQQSKQSTLK